MRTPIVTMAAALAVFWLASAWAAQAQAEVTFKVDDVRYRKDAMDEAGADRLHRAGLAMAVKIQQQLKTYFGIAVDVENKIADKQEDSKIVISLSKDDAKIENARNEFRNNLIAELEAREPGECSDCKAKAQEIEQKLGSAREELIEMINDNMTVRLGTHYPDHRGKTGTDKIVYYGHTQRGSVSKYDSFFPTPPWSSYIVINPFSWFQETAPGSYLLPHFEYAISGSSEGAKVQMGPLIQLLHEFQHYEKGMDDEKEIVEKTDLLLEAHPSIKPRGHYGDVMSGRFDFKNPNHWVDIIYGLRLTSGIQDRPPPPLSLDLWLEGLKAPSPSGVSQAPGGAAAGVGEPHYTLPGGAVLTTQRAGEFWLLDAPRDFKVQVRHTPWQGSRQVAAITAVAVHVGRSRVSIYVDGTVRLEGQPLSWTGRFVQRDLGDGHALGIWGETGRPSTVAVMASDGRYLRVRLRSSWIDVGMYWPMDADSAAERGLAGASFSDAAGTLTSRDGRRGKLSNPDDVTAFVDSWRIEAKESLFDYAAGESSATFDRRDFPETPANPSAEALAAARMTCEAAGVGPAQLGTCAFDVAVTGDAAFAQSHLQATQAMRHVLTTQSVAMQPPPAEPARGCDQDSDCGVGSVCDKSDSTRWRCAKRKGMGEKCSSDVECHGGLGGTQRICADKEKVCADHCRTDWDCGTIQRCKISNGLCSLR